MDGITLLRPMWLLAVLPLVGMILWSLRRRPDAGGWERVMPPAMLQAMQFLDQMGGRQGVMWHAMLVPGAITALIVALAGPALPRLDTPVLAQTDAAIIALDLSPSIAAGPALDEAKLATAALVQGLAGRPVGLIVYSGEAFTVAAPTTDTATLQTQIAVMNAETMPITGSRPADALSLAGRLLEGVRRADLIVVSDGAGIDPATLAEANRLEQENIRISTLRLDAPAVGAPAVRPDALNALLRGGGRAAESADVVDLAARLNRLGATQRDPELTAMNYRDLGPWFAALSCLPLLLMLRRQR